MKKNGHASLNFPSTLLRNFQDLLPQVKAVSFDVFDTTLQRIVYPKEVFALVEVKAVRELGQQFHGYADKRIRAEISARKTKKKECGHCEVSLEEIYEEIRLKVPQWTNCISDLLEIEVDQEKRCCRVHPLGHKIYLSLIHI